MLFNRDIEPSCSYCEKGVRLNAEHVACLKCGVVSSGSSCRHFKYDPLRRIPPRPDSIRKGDYKEEDFVL